MSSAVRALEDLLRREDACDLGAAIESGGLLRHAGRRHCERVVHAEAVGRTRHERVDVYVRAVEACSNKVICVNVSIPP